MISNRVLEISESEAEGILWTWTAGGTAFSIAPPEFCVDGEIVKAAVGRWEMVGEPVLLSNGVTEYRQRGTLAARTDLSLTAVFQVRADSPIIRFRYELESRTPCRLMKPSGADSLTYLAASFEALPIVKEVHLSEFNSMVHSYCLSERDLDEVHFNNSMTAFGPILVGQSEDSAVLLAYEHGSQVPDAFVEFVLGPDRLVSLKAVKGNYCDGQVVDSDHSYATIWMHVGLVVGNEDDLARSYREFVLHGMTQNAESRRPYIFYNTWNYQERNRWWNGQPYLESMRQERILAEIDAAHVMGIDVFVLDTGWYEKTGDWRVNLSRFPDGLKAVRERLDGYSMKMGLWFNPVVAAVTSRMRIEHEDCLMTSQGKPQNPYEIWETEASQGVCLVSRYWEAFADELIRLVREIGVTYFKWDAIGQYGCDSPDHFHGTRENTEQERSESYAFQQVGYMARVVDKLCAACPEAIVDFDITEGGRSVGLSFLSAGKYFLINNGPYNQTYDLKPPVDGNVNLFFYPGPARAWICRSPLTYDKWVPSVLFLTHYLPDEGAASQELNIASLVLGQNGIWGDLLSLTDEGYKRFGAALAAYKRVRDDVTLAALERSGAVGGSPEIYEKINPESGRGVVSLFSSATGKYTYVTRQRVSFSTWRMPGVTVSEAEDGRARIDVDFAAGGGKCVFFGVEL